MPENQLKEIEASLIPNTVAIISPQACYFDDAGIDRDYMIKALLKMINYAVKRNYTNILMPSLTAGIWIANDILKDSRLKLFYVLCYYYERMTMQWYEQVNYLEFLQKVDGAVVKVSFFRPILVNFPCFLHLITMSP